MINKVKEILDLKKRGKEGEEKINLLDDLPGPKTGIKITFNNIFNVATTRPLKIEFSVYMGKEKIFDEFGNPADYLLPLITGHVDFDNLFVKKKKKKRKRIDVEVDEVWYIVKDFTGLLKLFEYNTHIWLVFKLYEVTGESKIRDPQGEEGTDFRIKESKLSVGWKAFRASLEDEFDKDFPAKHNGKKKLVIKEGRYKDQLCRGTARKPPPDPTKLPPKRTRSWIDFTLETFVYETYENNKFAYRRRTRKIKKEKDNGLYDKRAFIPNDDIQWLDTPFEKGKYLFNLFGLTQLRLWSRFLHRLSQILAKLCHYHQDSGTGR
jgi:hypothetical protein